MKAKFVQDFMNEAEEPIRFTGNPYGSVEKSRGQGWPGMGGWGDPLQTAVLHGERGRQERAAEKKKEQHVNTPAQQERIDARYRKKLEAIRATEDQIDELESELEDLQDKVKEGPAWEIEQFFAELESEASDVVNSGITYKQKIQALADLGVENPKSVMDNYDYYYPANNIPADKLQKIDDRIEKIKAKIQTLKARERKLRNTLYDSVEEEDGENINEANKEAKRYKIRITRSGRFGNSYPDRFAEGTLAELIEYFRYTLEVGKSWEHEKGNKKINMNPKSIESLLNNLYNAKNNAAADGYYYELVDEMNESIEWQRGNDDEEGEEYEEGREDDPSDDLKSNFRSWEMDHDNQEDADELAGILADRHPHEDPERLRVMAYNWVGFEDTGDYDYDTRDSEGGATITTPEEFNDYINGFRDEIDGTCQVVGAQCMNDKIDVVNDILAREGVDINTEGWEDEYDDIIAGTWENEDKPRGYANKANAQLRKHQSKKF